MVFEYGPLALAMRYGGLFLLNEIDLTSPEVAAGLNGILDGSPLCIAENGGELIAPHAGFRFVATANTNGGGDDTGLYQGVQRQNLAFADRFMLRELGYPAPEVEKRLLGERFAQLPESLCATMVNFANEVRKLFMGEGSGSFDSSIEVTFSTRSLLRWADLTLRFQPLARQGIQPVTYALDRALGYRASAETRAMLDELAQRMFPHSGGEQAEETTSSEKDDALTGANGVRFLTTRLAAVSRDKDVRLYLRKTTVTAEDSRSKDWIGSIVPEGLRIAFGRTYAVNQSRFYATDKCRENDPRKELQYRAARSSVKATSSLKPSAPFNHQNLKENTHVVPSSCERPFAGPCAQGRCPLCRQERGVDGHRPHPAHHAPQAEEAGRHRLRWQGLL